MANVDKIIEDLIKGAERAGAKVELQGSLGREEKLASNYGGLGGGLGTLLGHAASRGIHGFASAPGGMMGAAAGADPGMGMRAAGGSLLGGAVGGIAGGGLGTLLGHPELAGLLSLIGETGGSAYGGHVGGKNPALAQAQQEGAKAACARFGIKHAFLGALAPMAGMMAGPALARGALGKIAPRMAAGLGQGLKGGLFDAAGSMGGAALGERLQ